jgi:hypothetical protein
VLAEPLGGRKTRFADPRSELEHPLAGLRVEQRHEPVREELGRLGEQGGLSLPSRGDAAPRLDVLVGRRGYAFTPLKRWMMSSP